MKRVTGLGGVFFRAADKDALLRWYRDHLGIDCESWGFPFKWREPDDADSVGYTVWSPFAADTGYFAPSEKPYMINYRVADLEALVALLRHEGVSIVGDIEQHENGKFAWILDPEGTKVELWEPSPNEDDPYL